MPDYSYEVEPTQWTVSLIQDGRTYLESFVFTDEVEARNYGEWMVAQKFVQEAQK